MNECRVVDLKKLGVSKEVFDKIYSMGEQDGRTDREKEIYIKVNDEFWHRDSYEQGYEQGKQEKCDKCDYFISVEEAYKSGCSDTVDKIVDIYNSNPEIDAFTLIRNLLKIKDENKFNLNNKNN